MVLWLMGVKVQGANVPPMVLWLMGVKVQGANVPPMALWLMGVKVRGNESSIIPFELQTGSVSVV